MPRLGEACVYKGPPSCISAKSRHLRPGRPHSHKQSKQMFSDVWSSICSLWSWPHSLSSDLSHKAGWLQQAVFMFHPLLQDIWELKTLANCSSICSKIMALVSFPRQKTGRPVCAGTQSGHPVSTQAAATLPPSLSSRIDHQTMEAAGAKSVEVKHCGSFFSPGRSVQRDALLTRPGRLLGERLKCPFSNEINKPTQALSTQNSFPGVPSGLVWLYGQS